MLDVTLTIITIATLLTLWLVKLRPIWLNRRQPLYTPTVRDRWADPSRFEDMA